MTTVSRTCHIRHSYDTDREITSRNMRPYTAGPEPPLTHLLIVLLAVAIQVTGGARAGVRLAFTQHGEQFARDAMPALAALSQSGLSLSVTFPANPAGPRARPCLTLVAEAAY